MNKELKELKERYVITRKVTEKQNKLLNMIEQVGWGKIKVEIVQEIDVYVQRGEPERIVINEMSIKIK